MHEMFRIPKLPDDMVSRNHKKNRARQLGNTELRTFPLGKPLIQFSGGATREGGRARAVARRGRAGVSGCAGRRGGVGACGGAAKAGGRRR
jgi:hypothetical protein